MATELGKAFVQIMPSAQGIKKQVEGILGKELDGVGEKTGKTFGQKLSDGMGSAGKTMTKSITLPALGAATAISGLVGTLGFKRLVGMDNAQAKLKGLGVEGKQLDIVMKDVKGAVTGTTHTMADGVDVAAGALAAGVKEGKDLERYIKLVGDAAVGSKAPMGEMAQIFNRVQGSGKLMGTELSMIEHRMPGFSQALAKHIGVAPEELAKMVSAGKVSSADFLNTMDSYAGGMSSAYAETFSGMKDNVIANIGIIGEALIGGLFEDGKAGMAQFLDVLRSDGLKELAAQTGEKIREVAHNIIDVIKDMKAWYDNLSPAIQDLAKKIALFGGIALVAIGPIMQFLAPIVTAMPAIIGAFKALGVVIGLLTSPIGLVVAAIVGAATLVYIYWEPIKNFFVNMWESIKEITINIWESLKEVWSLAVEHLKMAWEGISEFFTVIWEMITEIFMTVWEPIQEAWNAVAEFFKQIWNDLVLFTSELWSDILQTMMDVWETIKPIWDIAAEFFKLIWDVVVIYFQTVWTAIVEVVRVAWETIKSIVDVVIAVVTQVIIAAWNVILSMTQTVWNVIKTVMQTVWNAIRTVISTVLNVIQSVIVTSWNVIKTVITTVMNVIKAIITTVWNIIKGSIQVIMSAIRGDISGVWNAIKGIISSVLNGIRATVSAIWNGIRALISSVMNGIRSVISSVWNGILSLIRVVLNGIRSAVSNIFNGLRSVVSSAMSGVKSAVSSGMRGALSAVTGMFSNFRNAGTNIVSSIAKGITGAIGKVTDAMKNVTQKIRDFMPFSPPKTGPLLDIMDVKWGETIGAGIENGEGEVARAMDSLLDFDLPQRATFNNPNLVHYDKMNAQQTQPIIMQVDGKIFAKIMGDYNSEEGGNRIRKFERGLA